MLDQGVDWGKCVWLCTDRASNMAGCHSGATSKIKKVANKNLLSTYCIICYEHLAAQKLSPELNDLIRPVKRGLVRPLVFRHTKTTTAMYFYLFYFYLYIYPPDSQESDGGAIHKVGKYPDLLQEMPRYCCPLVI